MRITNIVGPMKFCVLQHSRQIFVLISRFT